jgi:hypothetical protein
MLGLEASGRGKMKMGSAELLADIEKVLIFVTGQKR